MLCYVAGMSTTYRPLTGPIRQFIKERGKSANALADEMGTDRAHLSRVLNGHVAFTWDMGHRIAVALGVPDDAVMEAVRTPEAVAP